CGCSELTGELVLVVELFPQGELASCAAVLFPEGRGVAPPLGKCPVCRIDLLFLEQAVPVDGEDCSPRPQSAEWGERGAEVYIEDEAALDHAREIRERLPRLLLLRSAPRAIVHPARRHPQS